MNQTIHASFFGQRVTVILIAAVGSWATGCAIGPQAKLINTRAEPAYREGRLTEVVFTSEVEAVNMTDEQLRYEVRIRDRKGRAVKSGDSQFRLKNGQVAASKTFLANELGETFGVRVTIPAEQLELRNDQLPAYAEAELYYDSDQSLATATCPIPISRVGPDFESEAPKEKPKTARKSPAPQKSPASKKPTEVKKEPPTKQETPPKTPETPQPKAKPKPKPSLRPDNPSA